MKSYWRCLGVKVVRAIITFLQRYLGRGNFISYPPMTTILCCEFFLMQRNTRTFYLSAAIIYCVRHFRFFFLTHIIRRWAFPMYWDMYLYTKAINEWKKHVRFEWNTCFANRICSNLIHRHGFGYVCVCVQKVDSNFIHVGESKRRLENGGLSSATQQYAYWDSTRASMRVVYIISVCGEYKNGVVSHWILIGRNFR